MTYKRPIKRNRNNTVRARARTTARKNMRKRNSYRYSGRGGIIEDIKDSINTATQAANSGLADVAAGITNSDAMKRMVAVGKVFNTPKDKVIAAKKLVDKAAEKVKSIEANLLKHKGEEEKLTQELSKAQNEHQDAKSKHMNALKIFEPAPMAPAPMKRPAPMATMKRPAPRRAATMKTPAPRPVPVPMKTKPYFNRTKYDR